MADSKPQPMAMNALAEAFGFLPPSTLGLGVNHDFEAVSFIRRKERLHASLCCAQPFDGELETSPSEQRAEVQQWGVLPLGSEYGRPH